jgi:hypothetical protein
VLEFDVLVVSRRLFINLALASLASESALATFRRKLRLKI